MTARSANTDDGARVDVQAIRFEACHRMHSLMLGCPPQMHPPTVQQTSLLSTGDMKSPRKKYGHRNREVWHGMFTLLLFLSWWHGKGSKYNNLLQMPCRHDCSEETATLIPCRGGIVKVSVFHCLTQSIPITQQIVFPPFCLCVRHHVHPGNI